MKFSLINVRRQVGSVVEGNWIQNHVGTLETATVVALKTEAVNLNAITVAVVDELTAVNPILGYYTDLVRLDRSHGS